MSVEERIELLKLNIRRFTHDLLHYDVIEIRLLDRKTGRLEPLLEEGMTPEAAGRVLYARAEGQRRHRLRGRHRQELSLPRHGDRPALHRRGPGARSSLTVPLTFQDQVIGTFNVESPKVQGLRRGRPAVRRDLQPRDRRALHTLELLSAEKRSTATQSVEAISREVALPVDDILTPATSVLDRYIGHDPEMADKLRKILADARSIKQCIQKVGEDLAPSRTAADAPEAVRPH